ncbi:MAG: hypothetical protein ACOY4H_11010 [Thermodesulfobacteriota bacterium]
MKKIHVALCCFLLFFTGCGNQAEEKAVEKQIEKETGGKADVDIQDKGMKITGETEGEKYSVTTGQATEIPANFPADVPLYQPGTPVSAVEVNGGHSVTLATADPVDRVAASYKEQMPARGWKEEASMNMGDQTMLIYTKEGKNAHIAVTPTDGKTHVTVTVGME